MAEEQLAQLKQAEALVLQDPSHYPEILPAVLALASQPNCPLRRWISTFLANTFASKSLDGQAKEDLAVIVVDGLRRLIEEEVDSGSNLSIAVPTSVSTLYKPLLVGTGALKLLCRCKIPRESVLWEKVGQLKSRILKVSEQSTNEGVRIACIKFLEKVIATQTPGVKDPRLADKSDISSTIVPLNHSVIHLPALEAESQGYLDRLLALIIEQPFDPVLAMAVINALGPIVKIRHTLASKIINAFLSVDIVSNPQNSSNPAKSQLQLRSVAKTLRIHLSHFLKTHAGGPLSGRIDQYLRTSHANGIVYDGEEITRKRPAIDELSDPTKKMKTEQLSEPNDPAIYSAFLLDQTSPLALYDAQSIPLQIAVEIVLKTVEIIPPGILEGALNTVRAQLLAIPPPTTANDGINGDLDDYDPEETIDIALDPVQPDEEATDIHPLNVNEIALTRFELPQTERLSPEILKQGFQSSIDRILQSIWTMDKSVSHRAGLSCNTATLDSLAITEWDKEAWITLISRLCSRALSAPQPADSSSALSSVLRERLFEYVMVNFREHMDVIILWLTEEWYNDSLTCDTGAYNKWATRIFDNILPFIESKDSKLFLRFLGDLPLITASHVYKLRSLCLDPERQKLGFASIKYLLLLRPPARKACIELCVDLYRNHSDTKKGAADILKRWVPEELWE